MDDAEDELEEETAGIGETSLDRIACALGGKAVMTHALQCINELLDNENWKCRHAGLCALSTIGEGCKRQMEPLIHEIVNNLVLPKMADPVRISLSLLFNDRAFLNLNFFSFLIAKFPNKMILFNFFGGWPLFGPPISPNKFFHKNSFYAFLV